MAAESNLDVRVTGIDDLTPQLKKWESSVIRFVGSVSASLAAMRIAAAPIKVASDFERELANVAKTTNFTTEQVQLLSSQLLDLSLKTNIATLDLAKIAAAAGQQGLGKYGVQAVTDFTESVSRMSAVLDITADVAGASVGKLLNIFRLPIRDVERLSSAFNEVSNNSTAKGEELLDVVKRIGDAVGTINLQQSLGLAASGIDFGVNPEVVGTAFSRVFAQMNSKAEAFGKLMKVSASDWIKIVQNDGIDAFKRVLTRLRDLEPAAQQETIAKLLGSGRIGALINKFVQDVTNDVLDRNLRNAQKGFSTSLSAINEQLRVLSTFKAQFEILRNSVFKTGAEIGNQALQPLTANIAKLSEALQSDSFRSFATQVGQGISGLIDFVSNIVSWIAKLNVNWGNFITLLKVFLEIKLAQALFGVVTRLSGFSGVLKSIANSTQELAAAQDAQAAAAARAATANKTSESSWLVRKLGIAEEMKAWQNLTRIQQAEADNQTRIEAEKLANQKAQRAAQTIITQQSLQKQLKDDQVKAIEPAIQTAAVNARAESQQLRRVMAQAAADQAAIQQRYQASVQAKEVQHTASLLQLEQDYQSRRAAILATGSRTGLTALKRDYDTAVQLEVTRFNDSIVRSERYWQRQIAITEAGARATVQAQQQALLAANTQLDSRLNARNKRQAESTRSEGIIVATTSQLDNLKKTGDALEESAVKASRMGAIMQRAGLIFSGFVNIVAAGGRILMASLGWIFLIYSVADALGLIDKLGGAIKGLAEKMGLVARADADRAVAMEATKRKEEERIKQLEDAAVAYDKLRESQDRLDSGVSADTFANIKKGLAGKEATGDSAQTALGKLDAILVGAGAKVEAAGARISDLQKSQMVELTRQAELARQNIATINEQILAIPADASGADAWKAELEKALAVQQAALDQINSKYLESRKSVGAWRDSQLTATNDISQAQAIAAQVFTDDTLQVTATLGIALKEAEEKQNRFRELIKTAGQDAVKADSDAAKAQAAEKINDLKDKAAKAEREVVQLRTAWESLMRSIRDSKDVGQNVKDAFAGIAALVSKESSAGVKAFVNAANEQKKAGAQLTGSAAAALAKSSSGKEQFNAKDREGELRRLARAQVEAARQLARDEINESKADADLFAEVEKTKYDRGLRALQEYYDDRAAMSARLNAAEIAAKKQEEQQITEEISKSAGRKDAAEKVRLQSDLKRVQSEIRVLQTQGLTQQEQNEEQRRKSQESVITSMLSANAQFLKDGLSATSDTGEVFAAALAANFDSIKAELQRLQTEADKGDKLAAQTAQRIAQSAVFKAANDAISSLQTRINFGFTQLDQYTQKLSLMQQAGLLTNLEARTAIQQQTQVFIQDLQGQIVDMQSTIDQAIANGAERSSIGIQTKLQELEALKIKLVELSVQADKTALEINKSITDSLAEGLGKLEPTLGSLKNMVLSFVRDIAQTVQRTLAKDFAEFIINKIGGGGSGGLGGLISRALGTFSKDNPTTDAAKSVLGGADKLGASAFNPLYVTVVPGLGGIGGLGGGGGSSPFGFLGSLFGGGGGGGGFGTGASFGFQDIGLFLHRGGTVGEAAQKRFFNPLLFQNAQRYHNGGVAGLKPNEVPAILEKGEQVISNKGAKGRSGGSMSIRNVLVTDPNFVPDALQTPEGERVMVTFIQRNKAAIKQMLGGR